MFRDVFDEQAYFGILKFFMRIEAAEDGRQPDEFVESIRVPLPQPKDLNAAYKISKRRNEDISSVAAGIHMSVEDGIIRDARIATGGMAATPKRAAAAEAALNGQPWSRDSFETAAIAMAQDFSPLTDWRASSDYRMLTAQNLLRRFFLENDAQTDTPVQLACA